MDSQEEQGAKTSDAMKDKSQKTSSTFIIRIPRERAEKFRIHGRLLREWYLDPAGD